MADEGFLKQMADLTDRFQAKAQERMDWIASIVPHPIGAVKLTPEEQVRRFQLQMQNPQSLRQLASQYGIPAVNEYMKTMAKLQKKLESQQGSI